MIRRNRAGKQETWTGLEPPRATLGARRSEPGSLRPRADGRPCRPRVSTCGPASGCEGTLLSVRWVATHPRLALELGREARGAAGSWRRGVAQGPHSHLATGADTRTADTTSLPAPHPRPQGSPRSCNTVTTLAKQVQLSPTSRNQELGQRTWVSEMAWRPWAHILCGNGGRAGSGSPARCPHPPPGACLAPGALARALVRPSLLLLPWGVLSSPLCPGCSPPCSHAKVTQHRGCRVPPQIRSSQLRAMGTPLV